MTTSLTAWADELSLMPKHKLVEMILSREQNLHEIEDRELTKKQACEILGVSMSTLNNRISSGQIKTTKYMPGPNNSAVRIRMSALNEYRETYNVR